MLPQVPKNVLDKLIAQYESGDMKGVVKQASRLSEVYPKAFKVWNLMGAAAAQIGNLSVAVTALEKVVSIKPNYAYGFNNLGNVYRELHRHDEAISAFERAISLSDTYAAAYDNLGITLELKNELEKAASAYKKAVHFEPNNIQYYMHLLLLGPQIPGSTFQINLQRAEFRKNLAKLGQQKIMFDGNVSKHDPRFNFAYHDANNKDLWCDLSSTFRKVAPSFNYKAEFLYAPNISNHTKIKVGFCSNFLRDHTIGKLYKGIIAKLAGANFKVNVIHHPFSRYENFWKSHKHHNLNHTSLPIHFSEQKEFLSSLKLDSLIFPDIGMDGTNYSLAHCRLAPIQMTSWGHPDTTGIDTVDYFISSELIEPRNSTNHYSEELIKFRTLPSFYEVPKSPLVLTKQDFGFSEHFNLYGCLQSLTKIHPDFDIILDRIAQSDPKSELLFIDSHLKSALVARWQKSELNALLEKSRFISPMKRELYLNLINVCDILLDPIYYGSGNTFYESVYCGVAQVSLPSRFMRGRIVTGGYKQMQLVRAPIVSDITQYHEVAVKWANSKELKNSFREEVAEKSKDLLFEDFNVIDDYKNLLLGNL